MDPFRTFPVHANTYERQVMFMTFLGVRDAIVTSPESISQRMGRQSAKHETYDNSQSFEKMPSPKMFPFREHERTERTRILQHHSLYISCNDVTAPAVGVTPCTDRRHGSGAGALWWDLYRARPCHQELEDGVAPEFGLRARE